MDCVERYVTAGMTAANRAAALTHRLLAFSRRQTLDLKVVDPDRSVAGMEELLRRTIGPSIVLESAMPAGISSILCDPNQLENALLNLAINARDAMSNGGTLQMFASERDMPICDYDSRRRIFPSSRSSYPAYYRTRSDGFQRNRSQRPQVRLRDLQAP